MLAIVSRHISAGIVPPVTPIKGVLSSFPTQTPIIKSDVKPINQASKFSLVVNLYQASGTTRDVVIDEL